MEGGENFSLRRYLGWPEDREIVGKKKRFVAS